MKDDKVYLEHIMGSFRKILEYAEKLSLGEFLNDTKNTRRLHPSIRSNWRSN